MVRKLLFFQVTILLSAAVSLCAEPTGKPRLNVLATQIMSSKTYDGGTALQVIDAGTLVGVETGHQVTLSATAYCTDGPVVGNDVITLSVNAVFSDSLPGDGKNITLHYSISGDNVKNYVAPADSIYSRHGRILEYISLDGEKTGNVFTTTTSGWCQEEKAVLSFKTLTGEPVEYSVVFSDEAKAQGFVDLEWEAVADNNKIVIDIPADCKNGVYSATVCFRNELGFTTPYFDASIEVLVNSNSIIALFSDVVAVDNIYDNYRTYQWYKNGERILGANRQFYQDPDGLNGLYYVVINEGEIDEYITCEKQFVSENEPAKTRKEIREGRMFVVMPDGTEYDIEGRRAK